MTCYLAIDIGASSGRHILGWQEDGVMPDKEVYRFYNGVEFVDGHLTWNLENLFREIKAGIREAFRLFGCDPPAPEETHAPQPEKAGRADKEKV